MLKFILENADKFEWSVQGLGMFRLYLDETTRLHIWSKDFKVLDVSEIHNHPWDFTSDILLGQVSNTIYEEVDPDDKPEIMLNPNVYIKQLLHCGENCHFLGEPGKGRDV